MGRLGYKDPVKRKAAARRYYLNHRERCIQASRKWRWNLKQEILTYYSNGTPKCADCREVDPIVLCIDHIDGDGNKHRKATFGNKLFGGSPFYHWLRQQKFPKGYQVLCWNCNARKAFRRFSDGSSTG